MPAIPRVSTGSASIASGGLRRRRHGDRPGVGRCRAVAPRCLAGQPGGALPARALLRPSRSGRRRARGRARCAPARGSRRYPRATSAGRWPPSVSVSTSIAAMSRQAAASPAARGCRRLLPGLRAPQRCSTPPAPIAHDLGRAQRGAADHGHALGAGEVTSSELIFPRHGYSGTAPAQPRAPKWSASARPRPVIFMAPKPGSAPIRLRRSARRPPPSQIRSARPPYSSSTAAQAPGRAAPSPVETGGSPGARGRRPRAARDPSPRSLRRRACRCAARGAGEPGERLLDSHLLVDRESDEEREQLRCEQPVRLVRIGEVERLRRPGW